jgi:uncharacterized protein (TIGR03083 family)
VNGHRYLAAHARIVELVAPLGDDLRIPATPGWSLLDLLAHLAGAARDLARCDVAGWSLDEWTAAQVLERRGRPRAEVLAEWAEHAPAAAAVIDDPAAAGLDAAFDRMPVIDATGHEGDILEAVGRPASLDPADWSIIGPHREAMLGFLVAAAGLAPLRVCTPEGDDWMLGGDAPTTTVVLPRDELWRSLMGRRSRSVVEGYAWRGDPEPYVAIWVGGTWSWPEG